MLMILTCVSSLVKSASNVIIRNIAISKVVAANGDAIGVRKSSLPPWILRMMPSNPPP